MELRTRFLPKLMNSEVEEYLEHNDIIIVPVGTVEMHGGFPLDVETVTGEAFALKLAEKCDGLVLSGLPYFYAGATASGRGTVQVSIRQGIDYLSAIAHSLLRQGFKRQIYVSFHGPAHMTCSPMVRDFFDETGVPILYFDFTMQIFQKSFDLFKGDLLESINSLFVGAYDILGRLDEVPLTTEFFHTDPQTVSEFNDLFSVAYQSGSVGYCFGDPKDHSTTPAIPTNEVRTQLAKKGVNLINKIVDRMDIGSAVDKLRKLKEFENQIEAKYPWMPSAYNKKHHYK